MTGTDTAYVEPPSFVYYIYWLRLWAIVRRPKGSKGWVRLPKRWIVERTFAWLGRCRRLSKDYERSLLVSEAWIRIAMIRIMLRRLRPA
ncbi:MAG: transposase [Planctomycetia bacterium]|nr:transposase [Planctomycetia bacterium]